METPTQDGPTGRIWFPGNPWPDGHRLAELLWTGTIVPGWGLSLGFELETVRYYEADGHATRDLLPSDGTGDGGWSAKIAWSNYHRCGITPSFTSDHPGIRVSDGSVPFAFDADVYDLTADPSPIDWKTFWETQAFSIYLLGHDVCADHRLRLERSPDGSYRLDWTGRIALAYQGIEKLDHEFVIRAEGVRFDAIALDQCKPPLQDHLARYVAHPERFEIVERHGRPYAVPRRV